MPLTPEEEAQGQRLIQRLSNPTPQDKQYLNGFANKILNQPTPTFNQVDRPGVDCQLSPFAENMLKKLTENESAAVKTEPQDQEYSNSINYNGYSTSTTDSAHPQAQFTNNTNHSPDTTYTNNASTINTSSSPQTPLHFHTPAADSSTTTIQNASPAPKNNDNTPIPDRKVSIAAKQSTQQRLDEAETEFFDFVTKLLDDTENNNKFWLDYGHEPLLSNAALEKLSTMVFKLKDTTALQENTGQVVELYNVLKRPISLCQMSIQETVGHGNFIDSMNEMDKHAFDRLVKIIDNSLKSSKLILDIYHVGHGDAALLREDLFIDVIECLSLLVNKILITVATVKDTPKSREFSYLYPTITRTLKTLLTVMKVSEVSSAVHKIQYLTANIIFTQAESASIRTEFQQVAYIAQRIFIRLFQLSNDRDVIMNELLVQTDQLNIKMTRRFVVDASTSIHNFSALLFNLLQTVGSKASVAKCRAAQNQCFTYCRKTISYLFDNATSGNTNNALYKTIFETLVGDALAVVYNPKYPAADSFLLWVVNELYQKVVKKTNAKGTVLGLDLLGIIANGLVRLKEMDRLDLNEADNWEIIYENTKQLLQSVKGRGSLKFIMAEFLTMIQNVDIEINVEQVYEELSNLAPNEDEQKAQECYIKFLSCRQLAQCYDTIISCIIQTFNINAKVKTAVSKALKMLSKLAEANPNVLAFGQVQNELKCMLRDDSSQVRDSALALVASYLRDKNLHGFYFETVLERAHYDPGLAPRKRAIQSLCDLYNESDLQAKRKIIRCLLNGIDDEEESVQKLARELLKKHLFQQWDDEDTFGDPNSFTTQQARQRQVDKISKVVMAALDDEKYEKQFLTFLSEISDTIKERAEIIMNVLVDQVTAIEEEEQDKYLEFISVLVRANPSLINIGHLKLLQSFPVEERDSSSTRKSRIYGLTIFRYALKDFNSPIDGAFLKNLKDMLLKRLSAYSISEINEGVPCLWSVVSLMRNDSGIQSVARAYKSSLNRLGMLSRDPSKVMPIRRLAFIIGCIGRYCHLGDQYKQFDDKLGNNNNNNKDFKSRCNSIAMLGVQNLMNLLKVEQNQVKRAALQNIGQICIGNPTLFQTNVVEKLYDEILKSDTQEELKDIAMKSLTEFVELDVEIADEVAKKRAAEKDKKVDISGNNNNVGSSVVIEVAQRYKDLFKQVALSSENDSTYTAARLLNLIGKQGLSAPQEVASVIIALMSSSVSTISTLAKQAFEKMFHKHESTLPSQTQHGIKLAAEFRRRIVGDDLINEQNRLKNLYMILHPPQGKATTSAKKFFSAVIRTCKTSIDLSIDQLTKYVDFVAFVVNGISWLEISHPDEVSIIIKTITEVLKFSSGPIEQLHAEYEKDMENVQQGTKLALMSLCLLMLWHLRKFLQTAYNHNGKLSTPKLMSVTHVDLNEVFDFKKLAYPDCKMYINNFHEAMALEYDEEEQQQEEESADPQLTPSKRRNSDQIMVDSPTKRLRFAE